MKRTLFEDFTPEDHTDCFSETVDVVAESTLWLGVDQWLEEWEGGAA